MAYSVTFETADGSLHGCGEFSKKSVAVQVAKSLSEGFNTEDAVRYLVEDMNGQTIKTFAASHR